MTDRSLTGRWALVTGASSGIGLAFAEVLAEQGAHLVLTARRRDRLDALATRLSATHRVSTVVLDVDLADPAAADRLVSAIGARTLSIDVLVNNAGFGVPGSYAGTTWADQARFLQVMVVAVAELTHRLLPRMIERRWGRIINVASLAGLLPGVGGHTLYAAAKAFVVSFTESLARETARHQIYVTASCPGFVRSEFHDVTGTRQQVNQMPGFMWLEADTVARGSLEAVMAGVPVFVPGRVNQGLATAGRLLPRRIVAGLMQRNASKFRRE